MQVALCKYIHRALVGTDFLGYQRKRCLRHGQKESQIVVPQVAVESVHRGKVQQSVDFPENIPGQLLIRRIAVVKTPADFRQPSEDTVLLDITVNHKL